MAYYEIPLAEEYYQNALHEFIQFHCVGKQYDSCISSPCRYASASGCTHTLHPKNQSTIEIEPETNTELRQQVNN